MMINCTVQGVSPLLLRRFTEAQQQAASNQTSSVMIGQRGTPREQAQESLYLDSRGKPIFPAPNFLAALIEAGRYIKAGRSKLTTARSSIVPAGLMVLGLECPLEPGKWEVDSRAVVVPATGGRIVRHRPRFDQWSFTATLDIDEEVFSEKLIRELVDIAGKRVGIGDFRPSRRGPFGRFKVTKWSKA